LHYATPSCLFMVQCFLVVRRRPKCDIGSAVIVLHGSPKKPKGV
jgi:hypothetical protein